MYILSGLTNAIEMYTRPTNNDLIYDNASGTDVSIQPISGNTWYTIKVIADPGTDTYDIYVNGVLKVTGAPFRNAISSIDGIEFGSGGNGPTSTEYIDSINITAP